MLTATAAALAMVLLHRADGGVVAVAPSQVTSLHAKPATSGGNKLVTPEVGCVVWLADGKILSVIEPCDVVRGLIGKGRQMIVLLTFTNRLPVPVELLSNMGAGQPVQAGQSLEMTFELQDNEDGVGDLTLICEPGRLTP